LKNYQKQPTENHITISKLYTNTSIHNLFNPK
jgi:hypothetical protein